VPLNPGMDQTTGIISYDLIAYVHEFLFFMKHEKYLSFIS
jgi:hypothetical protein